MGYSTSFKGELKFTEELTARQLAKVKSFLGEDCRDHPEWDEAIVTRTYPFNNDGKPYKERLTYIDLTFLPDFSGLKWDGSEKTYDLVEKVNFIIKEMQKEFPSFGLSGQLNAQGEDSDDVWILYMSPETGWAEKREVVVSGTKVTCPECGHNFRIQSK